MKGYIGDGVYVEWDGFGITIRANSPNNEESVYLEPSVLESLNNFYKRCINNKENNEEVTEQS